MVGQIEALRLGEVEQEPLIGRRSPLATSATQMSWAKKSVRFAYTISLLSGVHERGICTVRSKGTTTRGSPPWAVARRSTTRVQLARYEPPRGSKPSIKTMSASPSATAASTKRPSDDHETRRAMKVGRSPKSVI